MQLLALRAALRAAPDIARALGRLSLGAAARAISPRCATDLPPRSGPPLRWKVRCRPLSARRARRSRSTRRSGPCWPTALADPAPARLEDGGAIRPGFDAELDAERALRDDSRRVLAELQLDYAQRYGVASLKIRHHAQLGYVIEAPAGAVEKLRGHPELTLRQGMANGARFTTPELSDLDRRIAEAAERAAARERAVFAHLASAALAHADALARLRGRARPCWMSRSPRRSSPSPEPGAAPS